MLASRGRRRRSLGHEKGDFNAPKQKGLDSQLGKSEVKDEEDIDPDQEIPWN